MFIVLGPAMLYPFFENASYLGAVFPQVLILNNSRALLLFLRFDKSVHSPVGLKSVAANLTGAITCKEMSLYNERLRREQ